MSTMNVMTELHKQALKMVFSNPRYLVLSIVIFVGMLLPLSMLQQYFFLEPNLTFYVGYTELFSFSLIVIISALTALVLSMGIFAVHLLRTRARKISPGVTGSVIGAATGACGCISMNLAIIPMLVPIAGVIAAIEIYAIPLRLISIAILGFSYYITVRGISSECNIKTAENEII